MIEWPAIMRSWGSRLTIVLCLRRQRIRRQKDNENKRQLWTINVSLPKATNIATSQQWEEDGNDAEYIVAHQYPVLPSLAGFVANSGGRQVCLVQSVLKYSAQPLTPYTPVNPMALERENGFIQFTSQKFSCTIHRLFGLSGHPCTGLHTSRMKD